MCAVVRICGFGSLNGDIGIREGEMALLRFLAPLAAALLSACGASSITDFSGPQFDKAASEPAGKTTKEAEAKKEADATARDQNSASIKKVAMTFSSVTDPASKAYKIGPRDVLEVTVFKVPDLSKVVQVSEVGTISYPLVGEVQAGGRTAREVEQDLTSTLGAKYLQNPQVSVFVKEYNSQRVTVEGSVKKPGVVPIQGGLSLIQAVALSGGFDDSAEETIILFRKAEGKHLVGKFDVSKIRSSKAEDPQLEPGDVLVAPSSDIKVGMSYFLKMLPLANLAPYL
jgi:polysaccharide biosynthesis/export protein